MHENSATACGYDEFHILLQSKVVTDSCSRGYGCLISSKDRRGELREFHFLSLMKVKQKMLLSSLQCLKEDECVSKICPKRKGCRK